MVVLDIALPIFGIVGAGYLAGRINLLGSAGGRSLNDFVYYVALPIFLFLALARASLDDIAAWHFISASLAGIGVTFVLGALGAWLMFRKNLTASAIYGMAASYGTTGYMGVPLVVTAFGPEAALPAAVATLVHNIPAITAVIIMSEISDATHSNRGTPTRVARSVTRATLLNPLTIAVAAGLTVAAVPPALPEPALVFSEMLGQTAGPCALFALGLGLAGEAFTTSLKADSLPDIATVVGLKIVVQPLVTFLAVTHFFPLDPLWAAVAVLMAALPVGAGVYVFANRYQTHIALVSQAIVISMLVTVGTVSALLPVYLG